MIAALFLMMSVAVAQSCEDPKTLPESMQVAWISPASKTVGMNGWIEAVRVADLRAWVRDQGTDKIRLLRGLGMVGARGGRWAAKKPYKAVCLEISATVTKNQKGIRQSLKKSISIYQTKNLQKTQEIGQGNGKL